MVIHATELFTNGRLRQLVLMYVEVFFSTGFTVGTTCFRCNTH